MENETKQEIDVMKILTIIIKRLIKTFFESSQAFFNSFILLLVIILVKDHPELCFCVYLGLIACLGTACNYAYKSFRCAFCKIEEESE